MTLVVVLVAVTVPQLPSVLGLPPPGGRPIPISGYGVLTLYGGPYNAVNSNQITITVYSAGFGTFFITKLFVFLATPADTDLLLTSITLDGIYPPTITLSQYPGAPRVVVIPAGNTIGEVISVLGPNGGASYLSFLLVKEPLGNLAIAATGGSSNGLSLKLQFSSGAQGVTVSAEAFVVAPTNNTLSINVGS